MSSRSSRNVVLTVLLCLGCEREARETHPSPATDYAGNAYQISQGQRLFTWMNCAGCHAHGGGDIGPPLMDAEWRYGSSMPEIVATIADGRPNGMPPYRQKLTDQQMWQLAAYVRSLSGQIRKDAVSSRADEMSNTRPLTLIPERPEQDRDRGSARVPPS